MTEIHFFVPITPVAKARPRATIAGESVRMYTPKTTAAFERAVSLYAKQAMAGGGAIVGPVRAKLVFNMPTPKSWSKKKAAEQISEMAHTQKPDLDNLTKAIFDACNGIVYADDSQIYETSTGKYWSAGEGGVSVTFKA